LQKDYSDRANFIHVEIWFDFQDKAINKGAAEWLLVDQDLTEPWVYLIDANGMIAARWDNVATRAELEAELDKLPKGSVQ
ncbi:MAG: thioredoxin family protein, partial [Actinobacteria bacterium]|nr:thioredoxin family protein [Actinomycetota bacterium]